MPGETKIEWTRSDDGTPDRTWNPVTGQVLTKRPRRMYRLMSDREGLGGVARRTEVIAAERGIPNPGNLPFPVQNVWLGVSVENQEAAYRVDWLVKTPAAVRFLSCEPLLGPLDLSKWLWTNDGVWTDYDGEEIRCREASGDLHWIIGGGESGPGFRPVDLEWCAASAISASPQACRFSTSSRAGSDRRPAGASWTAARGMSSRK